MTRTPLPITVTLLALLAATRAHAMPVSFGASAGPVIASGERASDFPNGLWLQLDAITHRGDSNEWLARIAYADFGSPTGPVVSFFNGGQLYSPARVIDTPLRLTTLQAGLSHQFAEIASLRPHLEGLVGASWAEQPAAPAPTNDRRPDPAAASPPAIHGHVVPALSLGLGLEATTVGRLGVSVAAAAQWMPTERFNGVLLPVRVGAAWPVAPTAVPSRVGPRRGPQLRIASGLSALVNPTRIRHAQRPAATFAVALEAPAGPTFAWSLQGEHATHRNEVPFYRQEVDNFGNLQNVLAGYTPRSATLTVATLGLRVSRAFRRVSLSARAGAGWGRTGGFGTTETQVIGLYSDGTGNLIPLTQTVDFGAGQPATGFAWSGALGAGVPLRGNLEVFAEAGALGAHLDRDDVLSVPVRMGLAIR